MKLVLDASAAVRVALDPGGCPEFRKAIAQSELVIAPELIVAEIASVFWKHVRSKRLTSEEAENGLLASVSLVDVLAPMKPLAISAFEVAIETGRSAYDAFYLALAQREGATLLTADNILTATARELKIPAKNGS